MVIEAGVLLVVITPLYAPFSRSFAKKPSLGTWLFSIKSAFGGINPLRG